MGSSNWDEQFHFIVIQSHLLIKNVDRLEQCLQILSVWLPKLQEIRHFYFVMYLDFT
jgi:hypothetical protein